MLTPKSCSLWYSLRSRLILRAADRLIDTKGRKRLIFQRTSAIPETHSNRCGPPTNDPIAWIFGKLAFRRDRSRAFRRAPGQRAFDIKTSLCPTQPYCLVRINSELSSIENQSSRLRYAKDKSGMTRAILCVHHRKIDERRTLIAMKRIGRHTRERCLTRDQQIWS